MDDHLEEALRNEAVNRRLAGERRCDICRTLGRSTAWFEKWWARYRRYSREGLKSRSRAPKHVHNKMKAEIEAAVVRIRKILEERTDPELKYAFIGGPTIRTELKRTPLRPLPSVRAIAGALKRRGLTHPHHQRKQPNEPTAYCPLPLAQSPNDVHAMDIVSRHLRVVSAFVRFICWTWPLTIPSCASMLTEAPFQPKPFWSLLGRQWACPDCFRSTMRPPSAVAIGANGSSAKSSGSV